MSHENLAILPLALAVAAIRPVGLFEDVTGSFQCVFEETFVAVQQHKIELNFDTVREELRGFLEILSREVVFHLTTIDLAESQRHQAVIRLNCRQILIKFAGFVKFVGEKQCLGVRLLDFEIVRIELAGASVGFGCFVVFLQIGISLAKGFKGHIGVGSPFDELFEQCYCFLVVSGVHLQLGQCSQALFRARLGSEEFPVDLGRFVAVALDLIKPPEHKE